MTYKIADVPVAPQADSPVSRLLPVATTAAAAILSIQPVHIPAYAALAPALMLMAVYHWAMASTRGRLEVSVNVSSSNMISFTSGMFSLIQRASASTFSAERTR